MRVDVALRRICVHEASHAAVIERMGGAAKAVILQPNDMYGWSGFCRFISDPPAPSANWSVLVGLAGIVGELVASGLTDPQKITYAIAVNDRKGDLSGSDRYLMGQDWPSHVPEVAEILQRNWRSLVTAAARLERAALAEEALRGSRFTC